MNAAHESRPGAAVPEAATTCDGVTTHVTDRELAVRSARAPYALVVLTGLRRGGTRRNVYFSLPSAQAALVRAERRGVAASLHLVRLQPVPFVPVDALAELVGGDGA